MVIPRRASVHHRRYQYLPYLRELMKSKEEIHLLLLARGATEADALHEFAVVLSRRVIDATDFNTVVNERRMASLLRADTAMILVLALTCSAGVSYVVDQGRKHFMSKTPIVKKESADVSLPIEGIDYKFPKNRMRRDIDYPTEYPEGFESEDPWWAFWVPKVPKPDKSSKGNG